MAFNRTVSRPHYLIILDTAYRSRRPRRAPPAQPLSVGSASTPLRGEAREVAKTKQGSRSREQRDAPAACCALLASFLHALQNFQRCAEVLSIQYVRQVTWFQVAFFPPLPVQPANPLFGKSAQLLIKVPKLVFRCDSLRLPWRLLNPHVLPVFFQRRRLAISEC
jgi:hypothetical protein